jgi:hypothetical protein
MSRQASTRASQIPIAVCGIGAVIGAIIFGLITMDVFVGLILGAPIGLFVALIAYRALPRLMRHESPSKTAQANGAAPEAPMIEETPRPSFKMKLK